MAARAGARVALYEAKQFPRHKVCGEFVSSEALQVLSELLGDADCLDSLLNAAPAVARARLWLGTRMLQTSISPPARSITRFYLDAALWDVARSAGVRCYDNCEVMASEGDGPFELRTAFGTTTAQAVIIAAGRWSQFVADRALPLGPKWIGLKAHFREQNPNPSTDLYFFDGGYCGVQPIASDAVNACAMVRSDRASSLPELFPLHPALRERTASWNPLTQTVSTAPLVYRAPQAVRGSVMFVGDAAAFIDPFVGDGISIALRSGKLAAECLGGFFVGSRSLAESAAAYAAEYEQRFVPLLSAASRIRRVLTLPAAARAIAFELLRIPGIMRLLIRKTRECA